MAPHPDTTVPIQPANDDAGAPDQLRIRPHSVSESLRCSKRAQRPPLQAIPLPTLDAGCGSASGMAGCTNCWQLWGVEICETVYSGNCQS